MKNILSAILLSTLIGCVSVDPTLRVAPTRNEYLEGTSIVIGLLVPYNGQLVGIQAFTYLSGKRFKSSDTNVTISTSHSFTNNFIGCESMDNQETRIGEK